KTNEPLGVVAAVFGCPIVKSAKTGGPEPCVVETEQQHPHGGVQGFSADSVGILFLQPFRWVPHTFRRYFKAFLAMLRKFLGSLARTEEPGNRHGRDIFTKKKLTFLTIVTADRAWGPITKFLVHAFCPHGWRLDEVRVRGNNAIRCHC